ncbi:MAG: hypothetical protein K9M02_17360, partial [Thiohalocapsa sp.]|nr:hypothetical protein [Thiohalocapsa sp.]
MLRKPTSTLALAVSLALSSGGAAALGLGAMRTQSALNQPFYAEIELLDVPSDELDAVKIRLASREDFEKAGAERPHFLTRLQFKPVVGPRGGPVVQVTSREPMREPYLDFLLEAIWPQGRLVKEYTVLLDPPAVSGASASPPIAAPVTSRPTRRAPPEPTPRAAPRPSARAEAPRAAPRDEAPSPQPVPAATAGTAFPLEYGPVPPGAGLWRIARELTPPGATVAQTAMALYRNNQGAFVRGDINVLGQGAELVIPTAEELFALDVDSAERQFRDALAGREVTARPLTDVPDRAQLRIAGAAAEETTPAGGGDPSGVAPPAADSVDELEEEVLMVREVTETNRQETTELRGRIQELESQLTDIRRLLELRNERVAQLQSVLADSDLPLPAAPAPGEGRAPGDDGRDAGTGVEADDEDVAADRTADAPIALLPEDGQRIADTDPRAEAEPPSTQTGTETGDLSSDDAGTDNAPAGTVADTSADETPDEDAEAQQVAAAAGADGTPSGNAAQGPGERSGPAASPDGGGSALDTAPPATADAGSKTATDAGSPPPSPTSSLLSSLSPWALGAAGAGIALAGLGLIALRRRRRADEDLQATDWDDEEQTLAPDAAVLPAPDPSRARPAVFSADVAETQAPKTGSDHEPASESAPPTAPDPAAADAKRREDVLAEAEIYLLYGRYREAENLLAGELERSPDDAE